MSNVFLNFYNCTLSIKGNECGDSSVPVIKTTFDNDYNFSSNIKYSLFVFLLGYQQFLNSETPRVA